MSNYIFSPNQWTGLKPGLVQKKWTELNINSSLYMYIQFDIKIIKLTSYYRNIFHFSDNMNLHIRTPSLYVFPDSTKIELCNSNNTGITNGWQNESCAQFMSESSSIPLNKEINIIITVNGGSVNYYHNFVLKDQGW